MLDMAIGIVIGAAFGTIVKSFVEDLLTPILGLLTGGIDFSQMFVILKQGSPEGPYTTIEAAADAGAVTLNYGMFINHLLSFLIVAFALFVVVKGINRMRREEEEPEPTTKACPHCKMEIPVGAEKCGHCTSEVT